MSILFRSRTSATRGCRRLLPLGAAIALPWFALVGATRQAEPDDRTGQPWTRDEARAHAERFNDPALWNMKFLDDDVTHMIENKDEHVSRPFPFDAFNTPDYERTGRVMPGLLISPLPLDEDLAGMVSGVHQMLDPKAVPAGKKWHDVVVTEPLLAIVASGTEALRIESTQALSRSHPHDLFQGSFTNEVGQIRWVAVRMADGTELAIVNGRVLDLEQGNLVLIRQRADGSTRIHQHRTRVAPARGEELRASVPRLLRQPDLQRILATDE